MLFLEIIEIIFIAKIQNYRKKTIKAHSISNFILKNIKTEHFFDKNDL